MTVAHRLSSDSLMTVDKASAPPPRIRILAVEDEFLLSVVLAEDLRAAGYEVVGPFGALPDALKSAQHESFDFAVLDINIRGTMVYPLADELLRRGVPFIFLTGYGRADLPPRFSTTPRVPKPYEPRALLQEVERCMSMAKVDGGAGPE